MSPRKPVRDNTAEVVADTDASEDDSDNTGPCVKRYADNGGEYSTGDYF